jgi:hypothetical protein
MKTRQPIKHTTSISKRGLGQDPMKVRVQSKQSRNIKIGESTKNVTEVKEHNIENLDEDEINEIIQQSRASRGRFAKTDIESYQPLTRGQKIQVLEELNDASDKRILVYSELFGEIKTQINSLSNIGGGGTPSPTKLQTTMQLKFSMDGIKEVEDSSDDEKEVYNMDSPGNTRYSKSVFKKSTPKSSLRLKLMNPTQSRGLFDWRDSEENVGLIHIPQMNYKSNSLKAVDVVSGHKFSNAKYKTMNNL